MNEGFGYLKYDYSNKKNDNSRNKYRSKILKTSFGKTEIGVPLDRKGEFEPNLIKKQQRSISRDTEGKILSMYS